MKIYLNCLLLRTIFLVMILEHQSIAMRRKPDSILEIMNTREIEQLLAERRLNASRDENSRFIIQNDLDDDFTETPADRYRQQSTEIGVDFGYSGSRRREDERRSPDILMQYNDTLIPERSYTPDLLADLQAFRSGKILKSSKNALYVTRKEYLKKDWCKTEPLVQRIRENGCLTRTIVNRFCYGQCNSFYIPKSPKRRRIMNVQSGRQSSQFGIGGGVGDQFEDEDLTGAAFRSCGFCKPKKFTWITVTLRCPSMVPQLRKKRVQRIKQCKCMAQPLD